MPAPDVTEAICLTVQKFSETSKIAVLYTRAWGRISVIAKGAFRPKSQFWGHLEPLSVSECVVYKKPKEQIYLLSSCRALVPWVPLGAVLSCGYLMIELPWITWIRFALWMAIGLVIYLAYGARRSRQAADAK